MGQVIISREQLNLLRLAAVHHAQYCHDRKAECEQFGASELVEAWARDEEQFRQVLNETGRV